MNDKWIIIRTPLLRLHSVSSLSQKLRSASRFCSCSYLILRVKHRRIIRCRHNRAARFSKRRYLGHPCTVSQPRRTRS